MIDRPIDPDPNVRPRTEAAGRIAWRATSKENNQCDVLVVGSGCAGMSAAVTAGHRGLNVLIVEKEPRFGGASCSFETGN